VLALFRQNLFFNSLLLLPYTIFIRIHSLIYPESYISSEVEGWLNCSIFSQLENVPILQSIIAIVLIFLQAVSINFILNRHRLSLRPNLFPGAMYILLVSLSTEHLYLNPVLFANVFFLLSIVNLFKTYRVAQVSGAIFNCAFFIVISSLFYLPMLLFLLPCFIALFMLRSFRVVERMQYILGALAAIYLAFSLYFYFGLEQNYYVNYFSNNFKFPAIDGFRLNEMIPFAMVLIALMAVIVNYYSLRKKKSIQSQRKIDILYWFLLFTPLMLLLWHQLDYYGLLLISVPLSILIGMILFRMKNQVLVELIHVIALVVLFIVHFDVL